MKTRPQSLTGLFVIDVEAPTSAAYALAERAFDDDAEVDVGAIALAAMLSWLKFRNMPSFRTDHPALGPWLDRFSIRPSMRATPLGGGNR